MWYNDLFSNKEFTNLFTNLFCRWLDECKYEDINDYKDVIVKAVKKAVNIEMTDITATKRPFGIRFTTPNDGKRWKLYHTMRNYGVQRIG